MHTFEPFVFKGVFGHPPAASAEDFAARNPWVGARKVLYRRPRFAAGAVVEIGVGKVPNAHNAGHTLRPGIAKILAVAVLDDGASRRGVHTRSLYLVRFARPVPCINEAGRVKEGVVQESSLMRLLEEVAS